MKHSIALSLFAALSAAVLLSWLVLLLFQPAQTHAVPATSSWVNNAAPANHHPPANPSQAPNSANIPAHQPRTTEQLPAPAIQSSGELTESVSLPILMYHYIRVDRSPRDRAGEDLSVTPQDFSAQMRLLAARGFHTVTLDDLMGAMEHREALPSNPVILTFDDGYEDFYTAAYTLLKELDFKSTAFIITGKVGQKGYLTWDQIKEIQASGLVQFESHTVDHTDMKYIPLAMAQQELVRSKAILEQQLGRPVDYFCYPAGHYTPQVEALVPADGYLAAVSTHEGVTHSPLSRYALTRVRMHGSDTLQSFKAKVGVTSDKKLEPAAENRRENTIK